MNLGRTVAIARKLVGIRQADFAEQLGISSATVSLTENGKRPFPADRLEEAAEALGVPILFLLVDALEPHERKEIPEDLMARLDSWRMNVFSTIAKTETVDNVE